MKRFYYIFLALLMTFLVSCSTSEPEERKSKESNEPKEQAVDVDKGLLNVEITLPASMFEGEDIDTAIANAKNDGVTDVIKNEDGSITYKMTKAKHKEIMEELKKSITETIEETKTSEDYVSIKNITSNDSFSEFTLEVDKNAYENSMDGFAVFGLGLSGMMYQLYNGVDPDQYEITISVKDQATQEVFDEIVYPDALEEQNAE